MKAQNRSSAVMAQRVEPHASLEYFPTHPFATRALCEHVIDIRGCSVWEPACGAGDMARPLAEYALSVRASDVHDYGFGEVRDFLWPARSGSVDWIITNPPFSLAQQFLVMGRGIAARGVALLVRTQFLEGQERYASLFSKVPPQIVAQFSERVSLLKGRLDPSASSATAYCWVVWYAQPAWPHTRLQWIPPVKRKLTRIGDYP